MEYPYYIVEDVEAYRMMDPNSEEARRLSRKIAANIGDPAALRLVLGIDPPEFARFYPDMEQQTPSTMDTIDSFLDKFGKAPVPDSLSGLDTLPPPPPPPYDFEEIYSEEDPEKKKEKAQAETKEGNKPQEEAATLGELIKTKRFEEALALIEAQNLNNPQKSIYFAHQIRFIRKLMAMDKYLKGKNLK